MKRSLLIASFAGLLGLASTGCGIGTDAKHQEPLASMRVVGNRVVGQDLRVELDYRQTYPVDVDVECDLTQNGNVVQTIGTNVVRGSPEARPDATPIAGSFNFPFQVQSAGDYLVVCFTPADVENKLKSSLSVAAR
ncbi:MAG: hypothetical protein ABSG55_07200 [Dehalococcoidia bacterium]